VLPERLLGALAVDPLGVVGDGGGADLEAERAMAGETTPAAFSPRSPQAPTRWPPRWPQEKCPTESSPALEARCLRVSPRARAPSYHPGRS
jgi:hypothetical protein